MFGITDQVGLQFQLFFESRKCFYFPNSFRNRPYLLHCCGVAYYRRERLVYILLILLQFSIDD